MTTTIVFGLLVVNHISVTLLRAYMRSERLKKYYFVDPQLLGFAKGLERRILRPSTFLFAAALTIIESVLVI